MSNAGKFVDHYNELDKEFKRKLKADDYVSFVQKVKKLASKDAVVRSFKEDLIQFANLRNAIVHESKNGIHIAEPYEETVKRIEQIKISVLNPKKVIPAFQFKVYSVNKETPLEEMLTEMRKYDFSQAPLIDQNGKIIEIISANTISRWLFCQIKEDIISIKDTIIGDLIPFIEKPKNFELIHRNTTICAAAEIFIKKAKEKGAHLDCLIITHKGLSTESMLGLVCIEDIAEYLV